MATPVIGARRTPANPASAPPIAQLIAPTIPTRQPRAAELAGVLGHRGRREAEGGSRVHDRETERQCHRDPEEDQTAAGDDDAAAEVDRAARQELVDREWIGSVAKLDCGLEDDQDGERRDHAGQVRAAAWEHHRRARRSPGRAPRPAARWPRRPTHTANPRCGSGPTARTSRPCRCRPWRSSPRRCSGT